MFYKIIKFIFTLIFYFIYGWKVEGVENIPQKGGVIICCNHISLLDPPLVGCAVPQNVYFMAKTELFDYPILGHIIKNLNAFPVNRGKADINAIRKALNIIKSGNVLGIFPEGGRSLNGQTRKGEPGTALIAIKSGALVVPAAISGNYGFRKGIRIKFGEVLNYKEYKTEKLTQELLQKVTDNIMEKIESLKNN